jgi:hypothetical protein
VSARRDRERELGPGLHRVGPDPWDFVFNPEVGMKMRVVGVNGKEFDTVISAVDEDDETGEMRIT